MAHWLLKSEPSSWSWDQQVKAGAKGTFWNGVRNHSAKQQSDGDEEGRDAASSIIRTRTRRSSGSSRSSRSTIPTTTDETGKFGMVDREGGKGPEAAGDARRDQMPSRGLRIWFSSTTPGLSVQPVTDEEWRVVLEMAGEKA